MRQYSQGIEPLFERNFKRMVVLDDAAVYASNLEIAKLLDSKQELTMAETAQELILEDTIVDEVKERHLSPYKQRFADAPWFELLKNTHILLIGAGGIGSWVAFCLARIGCNFDLYDMDIVETHNMGGQLYAQAHVGQNKALATKMIAQGYSGNENTINTSGIYEERSPSNEIVIAAFDNMAGRKLAFNKWAELLEEDKENAHNYLFIDGRLLAEQYQVFAVTADRVEEYRKTLFGDDEVGEVLCTLKATTHCSMGIASDIISVLTNFATNLNYGFEVREVPFKIEKTIALFLYDITLNPNGNQEGGN